MMRGLLGNEFDDPKTQGLLALGLGLLGGRGNFGQAVSSAGAGAIGAYQNAALAKESRDLANLKKQSILAQLEQQAFEAARAKRVDEQQRVIEALPQQFMKLPDTMDSQDIGTPGATPAQMDLAGLSRAMMATPGGFDRGMALQAAIAPKPKKLSKLEPMRDPSTGQLVNVAVYEDGTSEVLPFGVRPDMKLQDLGDRVVPIDLNAPTIADMRKGATPDAVMSNAATLRGQNLADARARAANSLAADANNINREAARTQIVNHPELGPLLVDRGTGTARQAIGQDGLPIRGEASIQGVRRNQQLSAGIAQAEQLLNQRPTGSGAGALIDYAMRSGGLSTKSSETAAQLETLAGWLVANVPRMEGPQSNVDVENYKIMAARVGDRTVPVAERRAALNTLKALQEKYRGINESMAGRNSQTPGMPTADAIEAELRRRQGQ